jgi:hypothetical protein
MIGSDVFRVWKKMPESGFFCLTFLFKSAILTRSGRILMTEKGKNEMFNAILNWFIVGEVWAPNRVRLNALAVELETLRRMK